MLSIVIVNWNTCEPLRACLTSIAKFPPQVHYEIIVIDNASTDGSANMVANDFPQVILIAEAENWGYAKGNNIGFARASGDLILTLNPDTELMDESLELACEYLETVAERVVVPAPTFHGSRDQMPTPSVGAVAPMLIGPNSEIQRSVRGFPTMLGIFGAITRLDALFPRSALASYRLPGFDYSLEQLAPQPMGTFLMFRRSELARVANPSAPFDESFPIFFNEVDLLKTMFDRNIVCVYSPRLRVRHLHGASTRQRKKNMIWESHLSLVRYLLKHQTGISRLCVPIVAIMIYAAAFVRARGYHRGFRTHN